MAPEKRQPHDVSRETAGPPPAVAADVFGPGLARAVAFADLLASDGVLRGLIGPREVPRLWDRHLLNCGVVAPVFRSESLVYDVGSGAGLPGIVIALARPDLRMVLLEPLLRRTTFLEEAVRVLELPNVSVVRGRAEELAGHPGADYATARAVAPLDRLVRWCAPLLRPGGELVALKGEAATEEVDTASAILAAFGARDRACRTGRQRPAGVWDNPRASNDRPARGERQGQETATRSPKARQGRRARRQAHERSAGDDSTDGPGDGRLTTRRPRAPVWDGRPRPTTTNLARQDDAAELELSLARRGRGGSRFRRRAQRSGAAPPGWKARPRRSTTRAQMFHVKPRRVRVLVS